MSNTNADTTRRLSSQEVSELAAQLRADAIRASGSASSGHPTSSLSAADLMAALLAWHLRYNWDEPRAATNDHLVFSKGHASPLLYGLFKAAGAIDDRELIATYRRAGARLQGHPTPALPWVEVATGSLGQGLPVAVGIALAGKRLDHLDYRVWVLCGDSEMAEGSVWEALDKAAYYRLNNLTVIVDVNRLGQSGPTELGWNLGAYRRRVEAFGCAAREIDGHDLEQIDAAYSWAGEQDHPVVILARTVKGRGVPEIEDREGWHGKPLPVDMAEAAVRALGGVRNLTFRLPPRTNAPSAVGLTPAASVHLPCYEPGTRVATRKAYGEALAAIGVRPDVVVLDAEVSNSTFSDDFRQAYPERFFQMFIAEQQMIAAAVGFSIRGYVPFASTFAAFLTRAYDFIRMAGVSGANIRLAGSHAGVEIGEDGPSQMGLEDLAALRAVQGSTVLYPADAVSTAALVIEMAARPGVVYLRTTRGAYPVLYGPEVPFPIGSSKVVRRSDADRVLLAGAGITVHESLRAADLLEAEGIMARVIDLYSIKPLDLPTLTQSLRETGGMLVIAEDHHPEGGLGEAVLSALARRGEPFHAAHLAVRELPGSGPSTALLEAAGISAAHIARAAHDLVS